MCGGEDVPKERKISVREKKLRQITPHVVRRPSSSSSSSSSVVVVVVVVCFCTAWGFKKRKKKQNPKHLYLGYHFPNFSQKKPSSNGSFVCLVSIYRFFAFKRPRRRREIITKPSSSTRERTRTSQSRRRRHVFSAGGICRETALVARRRRVRGASGKVFVLEKKIPTSFRRNYVICVFAGMNRMHVCLSFRVLFLRRSSTI